MMWRFLFLCVIGLLPLTAAERLLEFSKMKPGEVPAAFRSARLGEGRMGEWKIIETEVPPALPLNTSKAQAPRQAVLAQVSRDPTANRYPLLILDDEDYGDFTLTTRFKLEAGVVEQMAGIAFRVQNESNFFYIRASGLYNNLRFIPVVDGELRPPVGVDVTFEKGAWNELKIETIGNQVRCWLNGKEAFPLITDPTFAAGKIAFWTKSDAVSYFADTQIIYRPRERFATALVREFTQKYDRLLSIRIVGPTADGSLKVLASARPEEIGAEANKYEEDAFRKDQKFVGRNKEQKYLVATWPLHDKNGDAIGAVRFEIDPFPGQALKNVLERTGPILREMEKRVAANKELTGLQ